MAVIRINKTRDYTIMSNHHLRNERLSLKAKGLLSEMLSLPNDWDYSIAGLVAKNKESKTAIQNILKELEDNGYLVRTRVQNDKGRFDYVYDIYEHPLGEKPQTEKRVTENPCTENQPQLNTNIQITKELNTNKEIKKLNKEILQEEFERLWKEYPKKQGKENALKAYIKARSKEPIDKLNEYTVLEGIKRYTEYIKANKIEPQFIKQGSTWFNQKCWEDDYSTSSNKHINPYLIAEGDLPF